MALRGSDGQMPAAPGLLLRDALRACLGVSGGPPPPGPARAATVPKLALRLRSGAGQEQEARSGVSMQRMQARGSPATTALGLAHSAAWALSSMHRRPGQAGRRWQVLLLLLCSGAAHLMGVMVASKDAALKSPS